MLLDAAALLIANWIADLAFHNPAPIDNYPNRVETLIGIYLTLAVYTKLYARSDDKSVLGNSISAIKALLSVQFIIVIINFINKSSIYASRGHAVLLLIYSVSFLIAARLIVHLVVQRLRLRPLENVLYVRDGIELPEIRHRHFSVDIGSDVALVDYNNPESMHIIGGYLMYMDRVVVACPPERRQAWSVIMKSLSVQGEFVDDRAHLIGATGIYQSETYSSLIVALPPLFLHERLMKRIFDIVFAGAALAVLAPLIGLVALVIKIEDGGPIMFVQKRTGHNNRFFRMYKFRSMRVERLDPHGARSTDVDDDRITKVGRFIRRTSIDELPQLMNVLLGDMSIVGPRPHATGSRAGGMLFWEVDQRYWQRHTLKPGLTGLAQIRGLRGATDNEEDLLLRLQCDLEYVRNWTLWRDLGIIAATVRVIVHQKAY
ncbi:sugar transferase [Novosphingobium sp.]|uniref:sugar transferase n=1 Tax=Novosphingobium sp. TaxID=1874826 RepID=UPI002609E1DD|nr:sugar transferase [Novosphingobium sp.]